MSDENINTPLEVGDELQPVQETATQSVTPPPEIEHSEVSKFFGFAPGQEIELQDKEDMKAIWNHFANQAETPGEVLRLISRAERQIEPPREGETRLGKFYTYVRLLQEEKSIQSELEAYKK